MNLLQAKQKHRLSALSPRQLEEQAEVERRKAEVEKEKMKWKSMQADICRLRSPVRSREALGSRGSRVEVASGQAAETEDAGKTKEACGTSGQGDDK